MSSDELGSGDPPWAWRERLDSFAEAALKKYPDVERIVLQPMVGAVDGACPGTRLRSVAQHDAVKRVLLEVSSEPWAIGAFPVVDSCDAFLDQQGSLSPAARGVVGRDIASCYAR